jgi:lysine biosynthesis protein LysW
MAFCPECEAEIEGEPYEFEEGEIIECPECGVELEVVSTSPLEFEMVEGDFEEEEEEEWDRSNAPIARPLSGGDLHSP